MFGRKHLTADISGLTCGHCVAHTTEALEALDGVSAVAIDLVKGGTSHAKITYKGTLPDDAIRAAVGEAGYTLESVRR